jgi:hypothetical protein
MSLEMRAPPMRATPKGALQLRVPSKGVPPISS